MLHVLPENWLTSTDLPWTVVSDTAFAGTYSARSGAVGDNQSTTLEITVDGFYAADKYGISFQVKVSSENGYDFLTFYIDDVPQDQWSGGMDWTEANYGFLPGAHTFRWTYTKDYNKSQGSDCIWIDDISLIKPSLAMVYVAAGSFAYQNDYDNPVHVDAFMIDKYEVTVQAYCDFLNADDPAGDHWDSRQEITRHGNSGAYTYSVNTGREKYPVRYVSYYDAVDYAQWRSSVKWGTYRLPTEQEWEKAAGWDPVLEKLWTYGLQRDYINCSWCNCFIIGTGSCYGDPLRVGSFNGSGGKNDAFSYYGCYDMSGNVSELTSSIYGVDDPVRRGGHWSSFIGSCEVTDRSNGNPSDRSGSTGFRLVLDLE